MEKTTTHQPPDPPAPPAPPASPADANWSALAATAAARLTRGDVLAGRGEGWNARPMRIRRRPPASRPGWGMHHHAVPELCLSLTGHAVMAIESRAYDFAPPRLAIIEAGIDHSECIARANRSYAILWINLTRSSMLCHLSQYRPRHGWTSPWRCTLRDPCVTPVADHLLTDGTVRPDAFDAFHANLLVMFARLHQVTVQPPADGNEPPSPRLAVLQHVRDYLDSHFNQPLKIAHIAAMARLSPNHLNANFRQWTGMGIRAYLIRLRMEKAMHLCRAHRTAIKQIALDLGYRDPLYFSKAFHDYHGLWPSDVR